jgi:hypothetical protein
MVLIAISILFFNPFVGSFLLTTVAIRRVFVIGFACLFNDWMAVFINFYVFAIWTQNVAFPVGSKLGLWLFPDHITLSVILNPIF